jgi:hypothetical protein
MFFSGIFTPPAPPANLEPYALKSDIASVRFDIFRLEDTVLKNKKSQSQTLGASLTVPTVVALFQTSLASAISSSATTMTLTSATDLAGTTLASSTYAFIIDEGTASQEMVIADCTSTACINMIRGVSIITGTTTVSALQKSHRRGASVKITDGPQLMILSRIINGIGTFPNKLAYTSAPTFTSGNEIITKTYADNIANQGAATSSETVAGISELATQIEMASSTDLGSDRPIVLQAKYATSSPGYAGLWSVVTNNSGKIAQGFLDLTETFLFTASTTHTATTSISASNVNSKALILNGLAYSMPSARAASSTVLMENGSGSLSWNNTFNQKFYLNTATGNISTSQATTTIFAVSVPANTLGTSNAISCRLYIPMGSATNLALLKLQASYGGNASSTILTSNIGGGSGNVLVENATILLSATGAASTQKLSLSAQTYNDATFIGSIGTKESTPNIDSTAAQPLIFMAQFLVQNGSLPAGQVVCTLIR